jgi:hypothetical protein
MTWPKPFYFTDLIPFSNTSTQHGPTETIPFSNTSTQHGPTETSKSQLELTIAVDQTWASPEESIRCR